MHTIAIPIANSVSGDIFFFMSGSLLSLSDCIVSQGAAEVKTIFSNSGEKLHKIGRKIFSIFVQKNY